MQIDFRWKLLLHLQNNVHVNVNLNVVVHFVVVAVVVILPSVCHLQLFRVSSLLVFPHHRFLSRPFTKIRSYQRSFTIFSLRVDMQIEMRFWLCQRNFPFCFSALFFDSHPFSCQLRFGYSWPQNGHKCFSYLFEWLLAIRPEALPNGLCDFRLEWS